MNELKYEGKGVGQQGCHYIHQIWTVLSMQLGLSVTQMTNSSVITSTMFWKILSSTALMFKPITITLTLKLIKQICLVCNCIKVVLTQSITLYIGHYCYPAYIVLTVRKALFTCKASVLVRRGLFHILHFTLHVVEFVYKKFNGRLKRSLISNIIISSIFFFFFFLGGGGEELLLDRFKLGARLMMRGKGDTYRKG